MTHRQGHIQPSKWSVYDYWITDSVMTPGNIRTGYIRNEDVQIFCVALQY